MRKGVWAVIFSVGFIAGARAQERLPNEPMILKPGEWTVSKGAAGKLLSQVKFWTSFPIELESKGEETRLRPQADTPLGIHFLRAFTGETVTPWQTIVVDDLPLTQRKERNNDVLARAHELKGACILTGTVQGSRSEFYKLKLAKGEVVTLEVLAQRLGSNLDPYMRVLDEQGRQLAFNEDEPGLGKDCRLRFTAKQEQSIIIEIRDSVYQGSDKHVYALRVGDFPQVNAVLGAGQGVVVGGGAEVAGPLVWDKEMPAGVARWYAPRYAVGKPAALVVVPNVSAEVQAEAEPNNEQAKATPVPTIPGVVSGRFEQGRDADWFTWMAKKGEKFSVRAQTRSWGSGAEVLLSGHGADGKALVSSKVAEADEGSVELTAPEDGKVFLRVTHIAGLGGPAQGYRLNIRPSKIAAIAKTETDKVVVPAGGTGDLKVVVERAGYDGVIEFALEPKVEGLTLVKNSIEAKKKEGTLQIQADTGLVVSSLHQFRVQAIGPGAGFVQTAQALTNQFGVITPMTTVLDGWVTVAIKAKAKEEAADKPKSP
jgi:hypothetical protein